MIPLLFAQLYITEFTWVETIETRAKSELRELSNFFFLLAQISSIVVLNVKNLAFTPCVRVCGGGGGGQDVITIRTSIVTPLSATVSCVDPPRCWRGGGQWLQMHFTLTTRVGIRVRYITMEMSTDVK